MTQINYEEEHRKLWYWLAEHPEAEKADYFKYWDATNWPHSRCFACEAAIERATRARKHAFCVFCPLDYAAIGCDTGGLYDQWADAVSPETRRKLARQIANLPWKGAENNG